MRPSTNPDAVKSHVNLKLLGNALLISKRSSVCATARWMISKTISCTENVHFEGEIFDQLQLMNMSTRCSAKAVKLNPMLSLCFKPLQFTSARRLTVANGG
jgi:hypothetical protein